MIHPKQSIDNHNAESLSDLYIHSVEILMFQAQKTYFCRSKISGSLVKGFV